MLVFLKPDLWTCMRHLIYFVLWSGC